jgi:hypothetical protein
MRQKTHAVLVPHNVQAVEGLIQQAVAMHLVCGLFERQPLVNNITKHLALPMGTDGMVEAALFRHV